MTETKIKNRKSFVHPWLLYVIVALVMLLGVKHYFQTKAAISRGETLNLRIEAALAALPSDGIEKATFYPGRDDNGCFLSNVKTKNENYRPDFTKDERRMLARYLKSLRPTKDIGMRGPWDRLGDINVDAGTAGRLRVIMTTRNPLVIVSSPMFRLR